MKIYQQNGGTMSNWVTTPLSGHCRPSEENTHIYKKKLASNLLSLGVNHHHTLHGERNCHPNDPISCISKLLLIWQQLGHPKILEVRRRTGRLKTRDLTSRDWTTRDHIARVDIARLISRHEAHFAIVVRGCCCGWCCRFRRPLNFRCWHRRLPVLVFVLAAAAVFVTDL